MTEQNKTKEPEGDSSPQRPRRAKPGRQSTSPPLTSVDYRYLFDANPHPMLIFDVGSLSILAVNEAAVEQYGYSRDEFLSLTVNDIRPPEDQSKLASHLKTVTSQLTRSGVWRHRKKDGTVFYADVLSHGVTFEGKGARLVVATDVTAQVHAEQAMRQGEARLVNIINSAMDAIITVDESQTVLVFNAAAERIFGLPSSEAIGQPLDRFIPDRFRTAHREHVRHFGHTGNTSRSMNRLGTLWGVRSNGEEFPVEASISQVTVNQKKLLTVILRDVTERWRADKTIRESEERYRQLFEEDLTGNFISLPNGKLVDCNPAFVRIFGFASREEALNANMADLFPNAEARQTYIDLIHKRRKLEYHEIELRRRDGDSVYVVETVVGSFDESGDLTSLKGYIFDNTERKKLEEQLLQSQKMEAVGQLASGIAHDFNNVMGVVLTASHLISAKSTNSDISRYARMIEEATLRGSSIAKQLLHFSRADAVKLAPVSLTQTVLDARKFMEHSFPKTIVIDVEINVKHGLVMADAGQIHQMILNLCINARDAILERKDRLPGGRIRIAMQPASGRDVERSYGWSAGDEYVLLSVSDDGVGMPEEIRRRIFDPFFTTKGVGKGTGLGLSIVHGIAKAHKAIVDVESQKGVGTTFQVYLPAIAHQELGVPADQVGQEQGRGEKILVIEDEPLLRDLLTDFLSGAGYDVIKAGDGEEGIAVYREHADAIDLVLSDIGLPKLDGEQVCNEILKTNPQAKVILCTGFIEEQKKTSLLEQGVVDVLHKPYKVAEVLSAVRSALDHRSGTT